MGARFKPQQSDVALLLGVRAFTEELGNDGCVELAYLILVADRIWGIGKGLARLTRLKIAGFFANEGKGKSWRLKSQLVPFVVGHLPGRLPDNPPIADEYRRLARWQATGLEDPEDKHFLEEPPNTNSSASVGMVEVERVWAIAALLLTVDEAASRPMTSAKFAATVRRRFLSGGADPIPPELVGKVADIRSQLNAEGFCVVETSCGFVISLHSRAALPVMAASDEDFGRKPTENELDEEDDLAEEESDSATGEAAEAEATRLKAEAEAREQAAARKKAEAEARRIAAEAARKAVEETARLQAEAEVREQAVREEAARLKAAQEQAVREAEARVMVFKVDGQSDSETFAATHRHIEERFGGAILSAISCALCEMVWPHSRHPLVNRNYVFGGGAIRSHHRRGEKGNDWYTTPLGQKELEERGPVSSLTDKQADEFIRRYGSVPRHEVPALQARLDDVKKRIVEIGSLLPRPVDFSDTAQDKLYDEQWELGKEAVELMRKLAGRTGS